MRVIFKFLFCLIVVSLVLTTISCSSRKMNKTKTEEKVEETKTTTTKIDSSNTTTKDISETVTKTVDDYKLTDDILITYNPTFDKDGNFIPFTYTKEDTKGNKTNVNIIGPGQVISNTTTTKEVSNIVEVREYKEQINTLIEANNKLVSELNSLKKSKSKDVKVAPDYMKYIIWIGIGIVLLTAALIILYFYIQNTAGKYKKIIDKIV